MTNLEIDKAYVGGEEADKIYLGEDIVWEKSGPTPPTPVPYEQQYLTIEVLEDGDLNVNSESLEYSINDGEWIHAATTPTVLPLQNGDKVRFRSNANHSFTGLFANNAISFNVYGNIESLEYGDNFSGTTSVRSPSAFTTCFRYCSNLMDASNLVLPATALANSCYHSMFYGCTSLTSAPELPATALANNCYQSMFNGCTNLTSAPDLPAASLVGQNCYAYMFQNCTALETPPELPATSLTSYCYTAMFWGCTSLTSAPELPSTTLTQSCYSSMFQGCRSLTQAPELPATTLASSCYAGMFSGCTSLNYIKCLATNPSSSLFGNVYNWVNGVQTNSGTFIKNPLTTSWTTGTNGIPSGWTILSAHPGEVWFEQSGGSGYSGITSDNENYEWTSPGPGEEWVPSNNRFWIVDDGHLVKADYQACGYEFDCDGVSITGSEGGWDDDNQEWKYCKSVTGATAFTTSYKIFDIGYTRASGNTPASVYISTQSNPSCEDCGLCTDEFGNCIECPDPCDDWEGNGYSSYEDCTCQNHGENCEEPEEEPGE